MLLLAGSGSTSVFVMGTPIALSAVRKSGDHFHDDRAAWLGIENGAAPHAGDNGRGVLAHLGPRGEPPLGPHPCEGEAS